MMVPFTSEDRQRGFQTMTAQLTPAGRVRRRFLQGRPRKVSMRHTPLSAVNAATDAIMDVLEYIDANEPTLPPDSARCALVYLLGQEANLRWITPESAVAALQELTALPEFNCIGLVFVIQEQVGNTLNVGGWVKPFVWSHEAVDILGVMLNRQLNLFKGAR
jgi:hypothetical protein